MSATLRRRPEHDAQSALAAARRLADEGHDAGAARFARRAALDASESPGAESIPPSLRERALRVAGDDRATAAEIVSIAEQLVCLLPSRTTRVSPALWVGVGVIALVTLGFLWRVPTTRTVTASAVYAGSPRFEARHAIDGDPSTEWLLPDAQRGWIEVRVSPARRIRAVALLNARNPEFLDRGTRRYSIVAFAGSREVASATGVLGPPTEPSRWVTTAIDAERVDRVRLVVEDFHGLGGGLAEIVLEE